MRTHATRILGSYLDVSRHLFLAASPELHCVCRHPPQPLSGDCPAVDSLRPESTDIKRTELRPLLCGG